MRKVVFILLICLTFIVNSSFAQTELHPNGVTLKLLGVDAFSPWKEELYNFDEFTIGMEMGYSRYLNQYFNLTIPLFCLHLTYISPYISTVVRPMRMLLSEIMHLLKL